MLTSKRLAIRYPLLVKALLASDCGTPLYVDECSEDELRMLTAWRQSRYCRIIHGPGRAWWCATTLGRVQLTEGA